MKPFFLVSVWYCGAKCFSLENVSKCFFFSFFYISISKSSKNIKKKINLMPFQGKHTFEKHLKARTPKRRFKNLTLQDFAPTCTRQY